MMVDNTLFFNIITGDETHIPFIDVSTGKESKVWDSEA